MRTQYARLFEFVALIGAFLWGGILRLGWPGLNPFAFDEARLSLMALELIRKGVIPSTGLPSSVGIPNLPAQVWLFAIPYAFSTNPIHASSFIGILSLLCLFVTWWIARSNWGMEVGLATAWLIAGSPYLVFYSRSVWPQNWLPILSVFWLATAVSKSNSFIALLNGFITGFAFQVHYAGIALFVPSTLLIILMPRKARMAWLGGFLMALTSAFIYGVKVVEATKGLNFRLELGLESLSQALKLVSGWRWEILLLGPEINVYLKMWPLAIMLVFGALLGLAGLLRASLRELKSFHTILLAEALASPLSWILHFTHPYIHYHLISLPALLMAASYSIKLLPPKLRIITSVLVVGVSIAQGMMFIYGLKIWAINPLPGGLSTPLALQQAAVNFVKDGTPVVALAPGNRPEHDGDAAVLEVLLWGYPHRIADGLNSLIVPQEPSWLLFVGPWLPAWHEAIAHLPSESYEVYFYPRRKGEMPWVLLKLKSTQPVGFRPAEPVRLGCGVKLEGWDLEKSEGRMRVKTLWRVEKPEKKRIHQFNHFYLDRVLEPFQVQDKPVSSEAWAEGDYLITWADFPLVEEKFKIAVGMYYYPSLERVQGSEEGIWMKGE